MEAVLRRLGGEGIDLVRIGWCDSHGILRGKTLAAAAVPRALADGIGLVSTILLKDTSDRTAYRVFEPGATYGLPGFGFANNLVLLPDPASFIVLPWAPGTGWMRAEAWFDDATPVPIDTRCILRRALDRLAGKGFGLTCGLEVEFHIYRLADPLRDAASLDPERAAWPGEPPAMTMIHPGYNLLSEGWADRCDEPLRIVQRTAQGLGLPLASLEIELGPSQVEAVFEPSDALTAADRMVAFRNGVTPGAAPRRLPRQLRLPAAVPERDGEWLAPAPVAAPPGERRQRLLPRRARGGQRRRATRCTCSPTRARPGSPACSSTAARWRCSARRRSTPTAGSGRTRWRRTR